MKQQLHSLILERYTKHERQAHPSAKQEKTALPQENFPSKNTVLFQEYFSRTVTQVKSFDAGHANPNVGKCGIMSLISL